MTSALVRQDARALDALVAAREAIDKIQTVPEAKDIADRATAAAAYFARAEETRDLMNRAIEVRVWAERRAAQIALATLQNKEDLRRQYGGMVTRWFLLGAASDRVISEAIAHFLKSGRDLTLGGIERRVARRSAKRVDRGIFEMPDGRFLIRWRRNGVSRQQICAKTLDGARHQLRIVSGIVTATPSEHPGELDYAYQRVRLALESIDRSLRTLSPDARAAADEATSHLHRAEDSIVTAIRLAKT